MALLNSSRPSMIGCTDMSEHGGQITAWLWIDGHRIPYYEEFDLGGTYHKKLSDALFLVNSERNGDSLFTIPLQWHLVDTNHGCMMHAGATAAVINIAGSAAVATLVEVFQGYKTGEMVIQYLARTRQFGNIAEVDAKIQHFGKRLAVTNVEVRDKHTREVLAKGVLSTDLGTTITPPPIYRRNIQKHPWIFKTTFKTFEASRGQSSMEVDMWDLSGGHMETYQKYLPVEMRKVVKTSTERGHVCPACEMHVGDRKEISKLEKLGIARPSLITFQLKALAKQASKFCPNIILKAKNAVPQKAIPVSASK